MRVFKVEKWENGDGAFLKYTNSLIWRAAHIPVFKSKKTSNTAILNYNVQDINKSTPKTYFFTKVNTPID